MVAANHSEQIQWTYAQKQESQMMTPTEDFQVPLVVRAELTSLS